jgi:hypothetical protein
MPVCRGARAADRVVPELAIVHRFARRLLVFELPDQFMLGFVKGARDVRVVGDGHERWETRQGRSQRDALFPAAAVLQRDFKADVKRVPPAQMRLERSQRFQHVRTFLGDESGTHVQDVLAERIMRFVAGPSHGADGDLISGDLVAE